MAMELCAQGGNMIGVFWQDGDYRFHVWLDPTTGEPESKIYKNTVAPAYIGEGAERRRNPDHKPCKELDLSAKVHEATRRAILDVAGPERVAAAVQAYEVEREAAQDRAIAEGFALARKRLTGKLAGLGAEQRAAVELLLEAFDDRALTDLLRL